jgi:thiosulfate/3-mercaptopyruvate sulfurtransferase
LQPCGKCRCAEHGKLDSKAIDGTCAIGPDTHSSGGKLPLLISVGPGATIPHSKAIGQAKDQENLDKLSALLKTVKKKETIVLYCGCCPYEHCPNVRPAIALLKEKGFRNYKLLNIPHNIKKDWIDKGYPKADL